MESIGGNVAGLEEAAARRTGMAHTDEWTAAALAHASVILTLILGLAGGIGAVVGPAIALLMYVSYRERSRFVAFQALQSFVYQVIGLVGYVVLVAVLVVWTVIAWTLSGLLSAVLIGVALMPFALLLTVLTGLVLVGTPLGWIGYGLYAAYQTYQGRNFRYWLIGERLAREVW